MTFNLTDPIFRDEDKAREHFELKDESAFIAHPPRAGLSRRRLPQNGLR